MSEKYSTNQNQDPFLLSTQPLIKTISDYYSEKLSQHGNTPKGVDWNGEDSQVLRFKQLAQLFDLHSLFTVSDLGCGYGAFVDFLAEQNLKFDYTGIDISKEMVIQAEKTHLSFKNAHFIQSSQPEKISDFTVASGIFNVRLKYTDKEWMNYIESTLDTMNSMSLKGFAFNCLSTYSDPDRQKDYLFYANPSQVFERCMNKYSKNTALLHDYGLYEFTILVRKKL